MSETKDAIDKQLLTELTSGAEKIFKNAEALYNEARILKDSGAMSRALFLHQISLEECAKLEMIGAWATSLLMGYEVDGAKVKKAMASHAHKNRTNAYLLKGNEKEEAAKRSGDADAARKAFSEMQSAFHQTANKAKNDSLYVDYTGEKFVAPSESITPEMVTETANLNEEFLGLSFPKLEMLRKWAVNPQPIKEELSGFENRLKELADQYSDDPRKAIEVLLQEMLQRRLEREKKTQEQNG